MPSRNACTPPATTCHQPCDSRPQFNRLNLDFAAEAERLGPPPIGIIDAHVHLRGESAVEIYREVANQFGIVESWSMTPLHELDSVKRTLGDRVKFIAQPTFGDLDPLHAMGEGFLGDIEQFHAHGSRIIKFWAAPRARDLAIEAGRRDLMDLDGPIRREQMQLASDLGMAFMTHVGDPDTWFATTYADSSRYGTKRDQYVPLERMLDTYHVPWIAAHLGGWPEDLAWLDGLLSRHPNLHLDTSATKWMVRTISDHSKAAFSDFLDRWTGRILFGSDIVAQEAHVTDQIHEGSRAAQSSSPRDAHALYASRYWALRTLFETSHDGPSTISDPDLHMTAPDRFKPTDAPQLRGHKLSTPQLTSLYHTAASNFKQLLE
ncbi:MAG: amidohydrolase family protein [Planctomycetes bacterium]|jgi:hypothetical protein|nr:amidohydrolase family protein [Planctomycetota bacterium]MCP4838458.1 amidohydrolase family protein [Planctomycetota bacterium]